MGAFALLRRGALSGGRAKPAPRPLPRRRKKTLLDRHDCRGRLPPAEELITHNLRLVVYLAKKYENSGVPAEDW